MINNSLSANTSIRTAIKNDLRLNYQTRVWLDVIALPAIELKEKIQKAMEENPFLEYDFNDNFCPFREIIESFSTSLSFNIYLFILICSIG